MEAGQNKLGPVGRIALPILGLICSWFPFGAVCYVAPAAHNAVRLVYLLLLVGFASWVLRRRALLARDTRKP